MIPMLDTVYEALKREYAFQEENGFNETEIDGMSGFVFLIVLEMYIIHRLSIEQLSVYTKHIM